MISCVSSSARMGSGDSPRVGSNGQRGHSPCGHFNAGQRGRSPCGHSEYSSPSSGIKTRSARLRRSPLPMRGFVKSVRLRRTPSLPPSHLVPIRILIRRRGVGCLLKSVFRLPLMPRTHRSECRNAVTGTGCKLTLDRRPSSTFAAFSNQNPSLHFRSFLSKSQMPSSYSRLVHHVPIRILSR